MKLGLSLGLQYNNKTLGASYDAATQTVLAYATGEGYTLPSSDVISLLDSMIISLKENGIWTKLDVLYIFATDGDRDFARINIKNPVTFNCTEVGTPLFTSLKGFDSEGNNGTGLDTNWNPSINGVNYTLDNASLFVWTYENTQALGLNQHPVGIDETNDSYIRLTDTATRGALNATAATSASDNTSGLRHIDRDAASSNTLIKNGASVQTSTVPSSVISNLNLKICGVSFTTTIIAPYTGNVSIVGSGSSLLNEASDLYSAFNAYITGL